MIIKGEFYNIKCDCCGRVINDEWMPDVKAAELEERYKPFRFHPATTES